MLNNKSSISDNFSSISIPKKGGFCKKLFAFVGPGLLISVGYMDPGNWATDIIGGAKFGYKLLFIILISNLFAIILQYLSIKLGVVTEMDLAQACKNNYSTTTNIFLWILCEISIIACDVAEIIGSALALNLLFHIPISLGIIMTALDVFIITYFQYKNFRYIELIVGILIFIIFICFAIVFFFSNPNIMDIIKGFIPDYKIFNNYNALYISTGILGATVMPHNLYLHSSIIQTRNYSRDILGKKMAIKYATIDSTLSLFLAFFINSAILIISSQVFNKTGHTEVDNIKDAYTLLSPVMGSSIASLLFAIALLASGQNSTITATFAGQIIMEGFINLKIKPYLRRIFTRLIAILPAVIVAILYGTNGTSQLLLFSQIIISFQLTFAVIPLITITNSHKKMGFFVNGIYMKYISWIISITIIIINIMLIYQTLFY